MFIPIEKFNCEQIVASLKQTIEERPDVLEFITKTLIESPSRCSSLKEWWQQYDTGWPLAACISIASAMETHRVDAYHDDAYIGTFLKYMSNEESPLTTSFILAPKLMPIIWVQYLMHHKEMEEMLNRFGRTEHMSGQPSRLSIWASNEDSAIMVSNPLKPPLKTLSDAAYLLFDPCSGLYRTNSELAEELAKIDDPMERMKKLVAEFAPNKELKLYCTSGVANDIMGLLSMLSIMRGAYITRGPRPPGTEH